MKWWLQRLLVALVLLGPTAASSEEVVQGDEDGAAVFARTRQLAAGLGVTVPREILLKVRSQEEVQVHYLSGGGRTISVRGYYRPFDPETIWVVAGQSPSATMACMAHELAHAWQSTNSPPQDRTVTEGFARWVEYRLLLIVGEPGWARALAASPDPDYGEGLRLFLGLERKGGRAAVLKAARTARYPEDLK